MAESAFRKRRNDGRRFQVERSRAGRDSMDLQRGPGFDDAVRGGGFYRRVAVAIGKERWRPARSRIFAKAERRFGGDQCERKLDSINRERAQFTGSLLCRAL